MMKGTLSNGYEYNVDEEVVKTWGFVKALRAAEKNKIAVVDLTEKLFGDDMERFIEYMGGDNANAADIFNCVSELVADIGKKK